MGFSCVFAVRKFKPKLVFPPEGNEFLSIFAKNNGYGI